MITTNQVIITSFYRTWCCLPHQCLRRTCSRPSPALSFSTRCCCPLIWSLNESYSTLKLSGGDCVLDPRGREVLERPLWSVEGRQDLGRQEKGAGEWRRNPSLSHPPFIFSFRCGSWKSSASSRRLCSHRAGKVSTRPFPTLEFFLVSRLSFWQAWL